MQNVVVFSSCDNIKSKQRISSVSCNVVSLVLYHYMHANWIATEDKFKTRNSLSIELGYNFINYTKVTEYSKPHTKNDEEKRYFLKFNSF